VAGSRKFILRVPVVKGSKRPSSFHAHTPAATGLLYADGAFHGLTCGALSLMGDPFWRTGFGPLLPDAEAVSFNNLEALEQRLASRQFAAFIVEPIQ